MTRMTLDMVNSLDGSSFADRFDGLVEQSRWVAEVAATERPFASLAAFHAAIVKTLHTATSEDRLAVLDAHPDLAGRAALAGDLAPDSRDEQAAAGLDHLTEEELARFHKLNDSYRSRFGFPFIMAVRNANKHQILAAFAHRITNSPAVEEETAIDEVGKIVWMRLLTQVEPAATGRLTVHVLDTARGLPAAGMTIELFRRHGQTLTMLGKFQTNREGRLDQPALDGSALEAGHYELLFHTAAYFLTTGQMLAAPPFLDDIPIRFAIANPEAHYHVPLLVSPWSFSTYRGS